MTVPERLLKGLLAGAGAGAAGTAALNATTYLDMAVRGRPSSSTPEKSVEKTAHSLHLEIPGDDDRRQNRLTGLGALSGIATGVAIGSVAGAARALGLRAPLPVAAMLVGASAMLAANGSMALMGVTDPRSWSAADWLSDVVPHVAYGLVTAAVARGLLRD